MFTVIAEQCTGCGVCADSCGRRAIALHDGLAAAVPGAPCHECGHCVASCPTGAARLTGYEDELLVEGGLAANALDPDALLRAVKSRRSIRRFKQQPVEQEKIAQLIEAGRYSPTGGNRQPHTFVVVQDRLDEFRQLAFDALLQTAEQYLADPATQPRERAYAARFKTLGSDFRESGGKKDGLLFGAPLGIGIVGDHPLDAGIAASNIELMAYALGLGMLYSGFSTRAAATDGRLRAWLQVPDGHALCAFLIFGYPDEDFCRSAPRKKARVVRL